MVEKMLPRYDVTVGSRTVTIEIGSRYRYLTGDGDTIRVLAIYQSGDDVYIMPFNESKKIPALPLHVVKDFSFLFGNRNLIPISPRALFMEGDRFENVEYTPGVVYRELIVDSVSSDKDMNTDEYMYFVRGLLKGAVRYNWMMLTESEVLRIRSSINPVGTP